MLQSVDHRVEHDLATEQYICVYYNILLTWMFLSLIIYPSCFPGDSDRRVCLQCVRPRFDPYVRKIFWRRKWLCLENPGCEESDSTEWLHFHFGLTWVAQRVKSLPVIQETRVRSLGLEDPLEEGMATLSSILAWRIPIDSGTWLATIHGVAQSQAQLSDFTFTFTFTSPDKSTTEHHSSLAQMLHSFWSY